MHIIVCIKQVPEISEVSIDPKTNTLMREGIPSIVNPFDENAIEEAVRIKEKFSGKVTVVTMGPPQAEDALRKALTVGADEAILITDRKFAGSDTLATAYILSSVIRNLVPDLVICGKQAIDGDTAQVGPEIAEHLGIPQITYVNQLEISDNMKTVKLHRETDEGYEIIEAKLPILITVLKTLNEPRFPTIKEYKVAREKEIRVIEAKDLSLEPGKIGADGSPTRVMKIFTPELHRQGKMIDATKINISEDVIEYLLSEKLFLNGKE